MSGADVPLTMLRRLLARALLATGQSAPDLSPADRAIIGRVRPYTKTSRERIAAMIAGARHIARHRILGDVVECGVWRGGSTMAAALALLEAGDTDRTLWLYDTFAGMPSADARDRDVTGISAPEYLANLRTKGRAWDAASRADVEVNLTRTTWPVERTRFIVGRVEETIPANTPARIALLRLDTDFYSSTAHELQHLYPRLSHGGILIIDDYGHWAGARQAVDEYFDGQPIFLHRVDYTGRLVVKP
jgi:hypothetical protein